MVGKAQDCTRCDCCIITVCCVVAGLVRNHQIEEPWTTWDVRKHRNPNAVIKVPVLEPDTADLTHIVMDVMDEVFDKYEDWLDLPPAKIKDLISHAMMLPEEKRAQYLLLAAGRKTELAELDSDTLADLMDLGTARQMNQ